MFSFQCVVKYLNPVKNRWFTRPDNIALLYSFDNRSAMGFDNSLNGVDLYDKKKTNKKTTFFIIIILLIKIELKLNKNGQQPVVRQARIVNVTTASRTAARKPKQMRRFSC